MKACRFLIFEQYGDTLRAELLGVGIQTMDAPDGQEYKLDGERGFVKIEKA